MIIEQTKEQMHEAIALHTNAAISWIRLSRSKVWSQPSIQINDVGKVDFDITFKPVGVRRRENTLIIITNFNFAILSQAMMDNLLVGVECEFEAAYLLVDGFEPSEGQIEAFQAANAIFNCWPFFREYVQSTVTRMNFPPPPVPFLRIVRKAPNTPAIEQSSPPAIDQLPASEAGVRRRRKVVGTHQRSPKTSKPY